MIIAWMMMVTDVVNMCFDEIKILFFSCFTAINFFTLPRLLQLNCARYEDGNAIFFLYLHYLDIHIRIFTIVINVHDVHDEPLKNLRINFNQNQLSAFECRKGKYLRKNNSSKKKICAFFSFFDCTKCVCGLKWIPHVKKIGNNMLKVYHHSCEILGREKSMESYRNFWF